MCIKVVVQYAEKKESEKAIDRMPNHQLAARSKAAVRTLAVSGGD